VIGVDKKLIIQRFLTQLPMRFESARGGVELHGAIVTVDEATGRATSIRRYQIRER
jgi:calcineurin-like phosphoesterase